jgi:hypothetical protein
VAPPSDEPEHIDVTQPVRHGPRSSQATAVGIGIGIGIGIGTIVAGASKTE